MSKAIDDLLNEHQAILSAIQILEKIADNCEKDGPVNPGDVQNFIGFLKEFADKCHHGKEEGILFPALVVAGIPDRGGPIGVMMREHGTGRQLIQEMQASISPTLDRSRLALAARAYAALLRDHIKKENSVLFPMAERILSPNQLAHIYEEFEEHEEKVIGHGRHEQLHALLHELQQKYQPTGA